MAVFEAKEQANHEGLALYMDGRTHDFVAQAQGWHHHESKDGKDYYNLLIYNVRLKGQGEIIDDHCWINNKAIERVLDTKDEEQRASIVNKSIAFQAEVGIYYPKKRKDDYGYCFRRVTHLSITKEDHPPTMPGGWRVQFLNDHTMIITHDTTSLSVSKCPSSGKLIAHPFREGVS